MFSIGPGAITFQAIVLAGIAQSTATLTSVVIRAIHRKLAVARLSARGSVIQDPQFHAYLLVKTAIRHGPEGTGIRGLTLVAAGLSF
jgi:hypothetical protein